MLVLPKVTRIMVLRGHNLADRMAAARAKLPLTPAQNTAEKASQLGQSIPGGCGNRICEMKQGGLRCKAKSQGGLQPI